MNFKFLFRSEFLKHYYNKTTIKIQMINGKEKE